MSGRFFVLVVFRLERVVTLLEIGFIRGSFCLDLLHLRLLLGHLGAKGLLLLFQAGYLPVLSGQFHPLTFHLLAQFCAHGRHILLLLFQFVVVAGLDCIGFLLELLHVLLEVVTLLDLQAELVREMVLYILVFTQLVVELVLQLLKLFLELFPLFADFVLEFVRGDS